MKHYRTATTALFSRPLAPEPLRDLLLATRARALVLAARRGQRCDAMTDATGWHRETLWSGEKAWFAVAPYRHRRS